MYKKAKGRLSVVYPKYDELLEAYKNIKRWEGIEDCAGLGHIYWLFKRCYEVDEYFDEMLYKKRTITSDEQKYLQDIYEKQICILNFIETNVKGIYNHDPNESFLKMFNVSLKKMESNEPTD
jgi:hypothetical protein